MEREKDRQKESAESKERLNKEGAVVVVLVVVVFAAAAATSFFFIRFGFSRARDFSFLLCSSCDSYVNFFTIHYKANCICMRACSVCVCVSAVTLHTQKL